MRDIKKCTDCPYSMTRKIHVDGENEPVGKYYRGRKFLRDARFCKMAFCLCYDVDACPLPLLTEEEIEERENEFDNIDYDE